MVTWNVSSTWELTRYLMRLGMKISTKMGVWCSWVMCSLGWKTSCSKRTPWLSIPFSGIQTRLLMAWRWARCVTHRALSCLIGTWMRWKIILRVFVTNGKAKARKEKWRTKVKIKIERKEWRICVNDLKNLGQEQRSLESRTIMRTYNEGIYPTPRRGGRMNTAIAEKQRRCCRMTHLMRGAAQKENRPKEEISKENITRQAWPIEMIPNVPLELRRDFILVELALVMITGTHRHSFIKVTGSNLIKLQDLKDTVERRKIRDGHGRGRLCRNVWKHIP